MSESKLIKEVVAKIKKISEDLNLAHPSDLTKSQFLELSKLSEWELRKIGGYKTILDTYFPFTDKELQSIRLVEDRKAYVNKLEKKYGSWQLFKEQLTESLTNQLSKIKVEPIVLNKKATEKYLHDHIVPSPSGDKNQRTIVSVWSDQHFGTNVSKEELGGLNEFNWVVGARRLGMLCEQIASYKVERRNLHEQLVIMLAGDNIGGIIHNQEGPDYDLITHQVNGTLFYYIQAINYLRNFFPSIRVLCQPGNHGRMMHKRSQDRALSQKYDSFENIMFYSLSSVFAKDSKVSIETSKAPFIDATIEGHRVWMSHGDTVFAVGNVGKNIKLEKIEGQIHRRNAEALAKGEKPFELFVSGHVHHPVITQVGPGVRVVINGCLIGADSFAQAVGIFSSVPTQVIWETTKKHVMGDSRQIFVAEADDNKHFETIIKPFNYSLSASKSL
jgi:predicted phosphodiesterase